MWQSGTPGRQASACTPSQFCCLALGGERQGHSPHPESGKGGTLARLSEGRREGLLSRSTPSSAWASEWLKGSSGLGQGLLEAQHGSRRTPLSTPLERLLAPGVLRQDQCESQKGGPPSPWRTAAGGGDHEDLEAWSVTRGWPAGVAHGLSMPHVGQAGEHPHFTDGETEAQRCCRPCPESHSW